MPDLPPRHLDVNKTRGMTITWADGTVTFYPIDHLRRLSPSADMRELRDQLARNPLTVLPPSAAADRKSTRLNSSHIPLSRMPSSA